MNPARIFCIGRNYAEHVAELAQPGAADDGDCVIFMKPASAVVPEDEPIVLPRGLGSVHFEAELVVVLTGGGRDIPEDEALDCVAGLTLGLDLTLRDLQTQLRSRGNRGSAPRPSTAARRWATSSPTSNRTCRR